METVSFCRPRWPRTYRDLLASASPSIEIKEVYYHSQINLFKKIIKKKKHDLVQMEVKPTTLLFKLCRHLHLRPGAEKEIGGSSQELVKNLFQ